MGTALQRVLEKVGMQPHLWESTDGSRAVLLPHGGRVLALFTAQSDENFFWSHPALEDAGVAESFYAGSWWHNSGGDRTWLAPEYELFFPDYPKPDTYFQPRQLDPGEYRLDVSAACASLTNNLQVQLFASGKTVDATIEKTVTPATDPLKQLSEKRFDDLAYAGYTLRTKLTVQGSAGKTDAALGVWNLLQLPHGGEMFVATHARAEVMPYFGTVPANDLEVYERVVRYRMQAAGEQKIGVGPGRVSGRTAYLHGSDENAALVVRSFTVHPSGRYVDVPFGRQEAEGSAFQACNINSGLGSFAELEYHAPAISVSSGTREMSDKSVLWAYRGPKSSLVEVARLLVSTEL